MKKFINRIEWHYDAMKDGGASLLDCLKLELGIDSDDYGNIKPFWKS